jgi:aconitate hydratase
MGVLPLQFPDGESIASLGITGNEIFDILGISEQLYPNKKMKVVLTTPEGKKTEFEAIARLDSAIDIEYYLHGGILKLILRDFLNNRV